MLELRGPQNAQLTADVVEGALVFDVGQLAELEEQRGKKVTAASNEMCTFLILNISSLQLIPVNMIAYRSQYGSVHPTAIVGPALAATAASTIAAVVFCKIMEKIKPVQRK